jgi:hypothetical protein
MRSKLMIHSQWLVLSRILILSLTAGALLGSMRARAAEGPPPEIIEKAKQFALKRDYPAVLNMMEEIDRQFKEVHNADYFYSLLALIRGVSQAKNQQPSDGADYECAWTVRKVYWKIYLTRPNEPKDAPAVWRMKQYAVDGGVSSIDDQEYRNTDQFVALRNDAIALLYTYANSVRAEIIPGYHYRPDRWATGAIAGTPPTPTPEEIAEKKRTEAEFAVNAIANDTQRQLNQCLDQLPHAVEHLVEWDFGFPPEDDQTFSALMDQVPPRSYDKETALRNIAHDRLRRAADLERMRRAQSTPAPRQPQGQ